MAVTTTPRFALPQWGAGADSPSRVAFNGALLNIDTKAAYDDGAAAAATLPNTDLVNGRYAATVDGAYRKLFRRAGGAWQQVGGNTWDQTTYSRADAGLATGAAARVISHPSLATAGLTENWDGSSQRGGRQAVVDQNSLPGALHVGSSAAADLATLGRVHARTNADGERGFVARAHAVGAGNLFTAIDAGGSAPWYVDSQGRQRAVAPAAFGGAALAAGIPLASAPGASDATALDLYAATGKPALRLYRAAGDLIGSFMPDAITLGKTGWTGGSIALTAPAIGLTGATTVTGNAGVTGTLGVNGATTLAALTANGAAALNSTLAVAGRTDFANDVYVAGRLDLPTTLPTGTAAGQVRVADDWALEVYDGSAWRAPLGNRAGRVHAWNYNNGALNSGDDFWQPPLNSSVAGSIATLVNGNSIRLNRKGLWTLSASFWLDHGVDGYAALRMSASRAIFSGRSYLAQVGPRKITSGIPGSGQVEFNVSWTGWVSASDATNTLINLLIFQYNHSGTSTSTTNWQLCAEFIGG